VSWTAIAGVQYYGLAYRNLTAGGAWVWANQPPAATSYTIEGLGNGTYEFRMHAACADNRIEWAAVQSSTVSGMAADCDLPTALGHTPLNAPSGATLTWTGTVAAGKSFQVVYWENSNPTAKYFYSTATNTLDVRNGTHTAIVANSNYTYYVNVWCNGQFGGSSANGTFTTGNSVAAEKSPLSPEGGINSLPFGEGWGGALVYPNPATEQVTIQAPQPPTGGVPTGEVMVLDMLGRVVVKATPFENQTTLTIKHLAKGSYVVKMTNAQGEVQTKKLVVE
jgi:hypothetical protein